MRPCDIVISKMFRIANKHAVTTDFILNSVQEKFSSEATERDIILKARREGFSSYIRAEFLVSCLTEQNTRAVILSQDTESTQKHLAEVKFYIKHMKGPQPKIGFDSKNQISFPKTDSTFYIGTAGSKDFGRGDTITHLLMSEGAFYPDLKSLVGSVMQAASFAKHIVIESTANGFNHYQRMCEKARQGRGSYKLHFYPWFFDTENYLPLIKYERLSLNDADLQRQKEFKLSREQMKWYITKREDFMETPDDLEGLNMFLQEYPSTVEEAFIASGTKFFKHFKQDIIQPVELDGKAEIFRQPEKDHMYVLGVDYSGGLGLDPAVIQVLDSGTLEQVAIYRDAWTAPTELSYKAVYLAKKYNNAYIVPELNNHGQLGVDVLKRIYSIGLLYRRQAPSNKSLGNKNKNLGFITTQTGKYYLCNTLKLYLRRGLVVHHGNTAHEIKAFEDIEGRLEAPTGDHDDCVIALGLAAVGIRKLVPQEEVLEEQEVPRDFSKPIYPFENMNDLGDIVSDTKRGQRLMKRFYGANA